MTNELLIANRLHKDLGVFRARFCRCQRLLHLIACRVLGSPERADDAIGKTWLKASRNPPQFEYEGEFRSWLLRVLIDEALAILRENQEASQAEPSKRLLRGTKSIPRKRNMLLSSRRKRVLKMPTQLSTKTTEVRNHHEQRITPNGTLFEFLVSPDETGAEICLIRGTISPGVAVPLHSHSDVELFYVLEGAIEAFQYSDGTPRWTTVGAGNTVTIPGNTKHALRNSSPVPTIMVVVTTSKLYEFFREVTDRFDPDQSATPPKPEAIQKVIRAAARYGYWMGSPEENAAIGLSMK